MILVDFNCPWSAAWLRILRRFCSARHFCTTPAPLREGDSHGWTHSHMQRDYLSAPEPSLMSSVEVPSQRVSCVRLLRQAGGVFLFLNAVPAAVRCWLLKGTCVFSHCSVPWVSIHFLPRRFSSWYLPTAECCFPVILKLVKWISSGPHLLKHTCVSVDWPFFFLWRCNISQPYTSGLQSRLLSKRRLAPSILHYCAKRKGFHPKMWRPFHLGMKVQRELNDQSF